MTELVVQRGRTRRTHSEQFKQELVAPCSQPGMSLACVAIQHGLHPNLLSRWVKERIAPDRLPNSAAPSSPQFVPVRIEASQSLDAATSATVAPKIEIRIDRGELRVALTVDPSQLTELGAMLREVLR